jgi:hypothetical protein
MSIKIVLNHLTAISRNLSEQFINKILNRENGFKRNSRVVFDGPWPHHFKLNPIFWNFVFERFFPFVTTFRATILTRWKYDILALFRQFLELDEVLQTALAGLVVDERRAALHRLVRVVIWNCKKQKSVYDKVMS